MERETWYIENDGKVEGPLPLDTIEARLFAGFITDETMLSRDGKEFQSASDFKKDGIIGRSEAPEPQEQRIQEPEPQAEPPILRPAVKAKAPSAPAPRPVAKKPAAEPLPEMTELQRSDKIEIPETAKGSSMQRLGVFLFLAGLFVSIYYFQFFNTTVETPRQTLFGQEIGGERVHNIGLMQDRQNGLIIGVVIAVAGFVCLILAQRGGAGLPITLKRKEASGVEDQLRQLAKLKEDGLIDEDEFKQKKRQILGL